MFDFEKFPVYKEAEEIYDIVSNEVLKKSGIDKSIADQLRRASSSIALNIAEGSGKFSKGDKRNFYTIARGSTAECVSVIRLLHIEDNISKDHFDLLMAKYEKTGRMLTGLIKAISGP